ncbi:MAG TPA: IDEAL domain-containing protein [Bacillota bacterium]|nr:IDEAL domain-containing protein [Bacillota bacterium]
MERLVSVKTLKPYYIKTTDQTIRVILAYQYFSMCINNQVYHFVPIEAKEIHINRKTRKIENVAARFAFQKGKDVVYMTMTELISLPEFLNHLNTICEPYYKTRETNAEDDTDVSEIIDELEYLNVKRLIDKALDERDREAFEKLVKWL